MGEAVLPSIAGSKFVLIEFSPELMNMNIDKLMEKFLLLENVDFELSTNGRMVTEMVDHQDKLDDQTKDNQSTTIGSRTTTMHINITNKELCIASLVRCTLFENKVSDIIDNVHVQILFTTLVFNFHVPISFMVLMLKFQ